ncbi:MAG: hypothetical protein ABIP51_05620 [Bacteroidia bacterium]
MNDRINKLQELKALLESGQENFTRAVALEQFFLGETISGGCSCKTKNVIARLQQYYNENKNEIL